MKKLLTFLSFTIFTFSLISCVNDNKEKDFFKEKFNNDKTAWENLIGNITDIKKQTEFYEKKTKTITTSKWLFKRTN